MNQPNTVNAQSSNSSATYNDEILKISAGKPSRWSITYDVLMLILIVIDLTIIMTDAFLMSGFGNDMANWLGLTSQLSEYKMGLHLDFVRWGGFITIFLIAEIVVRWIWAIINKTYYRWFFFPFVHWYEVLGCFPQLRALRLLRAVAIGYGLYQRGYRFLPDSWIRTAKFYYNIVMEEISDRVILIALHSVESELKESDALPNLIENIIESNRLEIEELVAQILQHELAPALKQHADITREGIGNAVHKALANVPELSNYIRMIPIAGKLIESQVQGIGQNIAESIVDEVMKPLYQKPPTGSSVNTAFDIIGKQVGQLSPHHEALDNLVSSIVFSSLETVRKQIKQQQWKQKHESSKSSEQTAALTNSSAAQSAAK